MHYFTGKRASGYIVITDPELPGGKVELETRMCAHCGFHGLYNPGNVKKYAKYAGKKNFINGICLVCMGLTCMKRRCNEKCEPLEKKLEMAERGQSVIF
jgi:hypothetical protein